MFDSNDGADGANSGAAKKFDIDTYWESILGKWVKKNSPTSISIPENKFDKDLKKGKKSEHDFYMKYQQCLTRTDGRRGDFELNKTSELLELKSDYYDPNKTENFFIERYSHEDKNGGIWQAIDHGVDYYVYWYPLTGDTYIFNAKQLLRKMNKLARKLELVEVKNQGYVTRGYKVERSLLSDLFLSPESIGLHGK